MATTNINHFAVLVVVSLMAVSDVACHIKLNLDAKYQYIHPALGRPVQGGYIDIWRLDSRNPSNPNILLAPNAQSKVEPSPGPTAKPVIQNHTEPAANLTISNQQVNETGVYSTEGICKPPSRYGYKCKIRNGNVKLVDDDGKEYCPTAWPLVFIDVDKVCGTDGKLYSRMVELLFKSCESNVPLFIVLQQERLTRNS